METSPTVAVSHIFPISCPILPDMTGIFQPKGYLPEAA